MKHLPRATVLVHERGARHLIDPTALTLGATAVYGAEEMERSYGRLVPVPAERVQSTHDGMTLDWHGRILRFMDTPGHARHHHCLWDETSRGWFTGDTFGLSYRVFDTPRGAWVMPTTTPVQFEPDAMVRSIDRLMAADPRSMYLTHYSRITSPQQHAERLKRLLAGMVNIGRTYGALAPLHRHTQYKQALRGLLWTDLEAHGVEPAWLTDGTADDWLGLDIELNAQGLAVWVDKQAGAVRTEG
jgi:glyoxylase-like metal-dependent hydrolase (beta-lactamase superfamily II)